MAGPASPTRLYEGLRGEGSSPVPLPPPAKFGAPYFPGQKSPNCREFCRCFWSEEFGGRHALLSTEPGERILLRNLRANSNGPILNFSETKWVWAAAFSNPSPRTCVHLAGALALVNHWLRSLPGIFMRSGSGLFLRTSACSRCCRWRCRLLELVDAEEQLSRVQAGCLERIPLVHKKREVTRVQDRDADHANQRLVEAPRQVDWEAQLQHGAAEGYNYCVKEKAGRPQT